MNKAYTIIHLALIMVVMSLMFAIVLPTIQQRYIQAEVMQIRNKIYAASLDPVSQPMKPKACPASTDQEENLSYPCPFQDNSSTTPTESQVSNSDTTAPQLLAQCEKTARESSGALFSHNDYGNTQSQNIRKHTRMEAGNNKKTRQARLKRAFMRAMLREHGYRNLRTFTSATQLMKAPGALAQERN